MHNIMATKINYLTETITATLPSIVHFNFEEMLQKHFGLKGSLYTGKTYDQCVKEAGPDGDELALFFTKEGQDAWGRALDFVDALEEAGVIDLDIKGRITHCFCDNA